MNIGSFGRVVLLLGLVLLAGCRTSPVKNVESAPVDQIGGRILSLEDVETAIFRASITTKPAWQSRKVAPGHIVSTIELRPRMAQVDIYFDPRKYSIRYRNSDNLKYNGAQIHNLYNVWVDNLDAAIRKQLSVY